MRLIALFTLVAAPAFADCPDGTDYSNEIEAITERMQAAPHEGAARGLAGELWAIWLDAPDPVAQAMLNEGMALSRMGDHALSREVFTQLITYCPDYAEGYNQRAFAAFLTRDFEAALPDLDRAIALQPAHLGALTGKAMTLIGMGREEEAQEVLRTALAINPWLAERALLDAPAGQDI